MRYTEQWVDHAREQFNSLSTPVRRSVMAAVAQLCDDPHQGTYNSKTDIWSFHFDYGWIFYAVHDRVLRITILRVSAPGS